MVSGLGASIVAWQGHVEKASTAVAACVIFSLMCLVVADVLGRKLFNAPIQGAIEVTELTLVVIVYLSVAYVQGCREHIRLELFSSRVSASVLRRLDFVSLLISLVICLIITWRIGLFAWESWITDDHTMGLVEIPIWPSKVAVFFGFTLLSLRLVIDIVGAVVGVDTGHEREDMPADGDE